MAMMVINHDDDFKEEHDDDDDFEEEHDHGQDGAIGSADRLLAIRH